MVKPKNFGVILSSIHGVYNPGQTVEGYVNVELEKEMKMKEIRIEYYGGALVRWRERHHNKKRKTRRRKYYRSSEAYFSTNCILYGRAQSQTDEVVLPPGIYKYPFSFQLPMGCPSSFETRTGHVRYYAQAVIDRPWQFNHRSLCVFTVLTPLDLNQVPNALNALHMEDTKTTCCLCCKAGPVRAVIDLPKTGYVPGESIMIKAEVNNEGSKEVKAVFAELQMVTSCHAHSRTKRDYQIVSSVAHGGLKTGETDYWNNELIPVPPLPASHLPGCNIIDVNYFARIRASVVGFGMDVCVPVEVIIGSIPVSQQMYGGTVAALPPPPTYAQYSSGQTDEQESEGEEVPPEENEDTVAGEGFAPKYTYYDFSKTGSSQPAAAKR